MANKKFVDRTSEIKNTPEPDQVVLHHVPFKIEYDGPATVDSKFTSKSSPSPDNPDVLINQFRGRPLHGQKLELPKEFEGVITSDLKRSSGLGNESTEGTEISIVNKFDSMTYWNWDRVPSGMDKQIKLLDWLELSQILHEPVSTSKPE